MEIVRQKLSALLDLLQPADALQFLEEERARLGEKLQINESKLTNGTQGERMLCKELGLKWNSTSVHGCDAWDSLKRPVEIKLFKQQTKGRSNINYDFGKPKASENRTEHARRVRCKLLEITGGHYWAQTSHGHTRLVTHWHVPCKSFAYAVEAYMLEHPDRDKINLGSTYCARCHLSHRVEEIAKRLRSTDSKQWTFPERVKQNCGR